MKIDTYVSALKRSKFLTVRAGTDVSGMSVPDSDFSSVTPFKKGYDIQPDTHRIAMDTNDIIKQIADSGFALHGADIEFKIG